MTPRRRLYSFSIDDDLRDGLQAWRRRYGVSEAAQVRMGIRLWLDLSAEQKQQMLERFEVAERKDEAMPIVQRQITRSTMEEDVSGKGVLRREGSDEHSPVTYRLTVERERIRAGDQWLDGLLEIEAKVQMDDEGLLLSAINNSWPLVLELQDGRVFECFASDLGGRLIARTGNALRPNK